MRILFISGNQEKLPDPVIPLGLLHIIANLPSKHEYHLVDFCFEIKPFENILNEINNWVPDLIAIGIRNIHDNNYTGANNTLNFYLRLINQIKTLTKSPIVIGGAGFSVFPYEIMNFLMPDFGIYGEAEDKFPLLLEALNIGDFSKIPNLFYFKDRALIQNPKTTQYILKLETNLSKVKSILPIQYYKECGIDSIQTKRGCSFNCTYCSYPKIEGKQNRLRSPQEVVSEMIETRKTLPLINHFFIVDSVFNFPVNHALDVCEEMINQKLDTPWTCYINPKYLSMDLAIKMKEAGCAGIEIGSDSGNDNILKKLQKGFQTHDIIWAHEICKKAKLKDCHTFILGTPDETIEEVKHSLEFITKLDPYAAILMICYDDTSIGSATNTFKAPLIHQQILDLLKSKSQDQKHWITPPLGINFNPAILKFLRSRGINGPLWQCIRETL